MAKHQFLIGMTDENGILAGAQCARCSQNVLFENGKVPDDIAAQECVREDFSQSAARIVIEATEKV